MRFCIRARAHKTLATSRPGVRLSKAASREVANCRTIHRARTCLGSFLLDTNVWTRFGKSPLLAELTDTRENSPSSPARVSCILHFFGEKVFKCVFLQSITLSHCIVKLFTAHFMRFLVFVRMGSDEAAEMMILWKSKKHNFSPFSEKCLGSRVCVQ